MGAYKTQSSCILGCRSHCDESLCCVTVPGVLRCRVVVSQRCWLLIGAGLDQGTGDSRPPPPGFMTTRPVLVLARSSPGTASHYFWSSLIFRIIWPASTQHFFFSCPINLLESTCCYLLPSNKSFTERVPRACRP